MPQGLEDNGLIKKKILGSIPNSTEYQLTEKGKALNKVIYELAILPLKNVLIMIMKMKRSKKY